LKTGKYLKYLVHIGAEGFVVVVEWKYLNFSICDVRFPEKDNGKLQYN